MNVVEELESFRRDVAGCRVAALVDLSTTMVLSTATATRLPQEELDSLAAAAKGALAGPMPEAALGCEGEDPPEAMEALLATGAETRAFLRGAAGRQEALVCVCGPEASPVEVFEAGRRTLLSIMADG